MKKFLLAIAASVVAVCAAFSGCVTVQGADGKDGRDLTINDVYEQVNAERVANGQSELSFLDFVKEYLSFDATAVSDAAQLQTAINRSLFSSVSLIASFTSRGSVKSYAGAGVIVDIDKTNGNAYILTNCHVVYSDNKDTTLATDVKAYLYGNDSYLNLANKQGDYGMQAKIVGASVTYDLALLKIENSDIIKNSDARAAVFAEEEEVYPGQPVFIIGDPEGDGMSVCSGIVSTESEVVSLNLSDRYPSNSAFYNDYRVIRTDAAVNGGNSGGGLFDSSGRLVGIINSKLESSSIDNIGYALAGSYARRIFKLFMDGYGNAVNDTLHLTRAVNDLNYSYTSTVSLDKTTGIARISDKVIIQKSLGSFTDDGGLRVGDVVQRIRVLDGDTVVEDVPVTRYFNLDDVILSARAGYKIEYTVKRGDTDVTVLLTPTFDDAET